jgi:hypothetical protein
MPAYALELNARKNVGAYLRANQLSRPVWDSDKAIVLACKAASNIVINDPPR